MIKKVNFILFFFLKKSLVILIPLQLPVDVGCFHVLAIANSAAMNTRVRVFLNNHSSKNPIIFGCSYLRCYTWAFSSCSMRELLFAMVPERLLRPSTGSRVRGLGSYSTRA